MDTALCHGSKSHRDTGEGPGTAPRKFGNKGLHVSGPDRGVYDTRPPRGTSVTSAEGTGDRGPVLRVSGTTSGSLGFERRRLGDDGGLFVNVRNTKFFPSGMRVWKRSGSRRPKDRTRSQGDRPDLGFSCEWWVETTGVSWYNCRWVDVSCWTGFGTVVLLSLGHPTRVRIFVTVGSPTDPSGKPLETKVTLNE